VTDELDGDLLGQPLAPRLRIVVSDASQGLELSEHFLDLSMVVFEDLDHITLLADHRCLLMFASPRPSDQRGSTRNRGRENRRIVRRTALGAGF
jgi:hypothetical protein